MKQAPPPPFEPSHALKLYKHLGSFAAVGRALGCHSETVSKYLRREGVRFAPKGTRDPRTEGIYWAWRRMRNACRSPSHKAYHHYGARGIGSCREWERYDVFRKWALAHGWKPGTALQLVDWNRDFSPKNCCFGPPRTHVPGARVLHEHRLRAFGETKNITEWSRDPRCRVSYPTLLSRLTYGFPLRDALVLPPRARPKRYVRFERTRRLDRSTDWGRVERLVLQRGLSYSAAARKLGLLSGTVSRHFRSKGLGVREKRRRHKDDGPLYGSFTAMWTRARQEVNGSRRRPRVAEAWSDYPAFRAWARRSGYRRGRCLVRVDRDGRWEPANCRFVKRSDFPHYQRTPKPGARPPRVPLTAWGETKGITAWSRDPRCVVSHPTVRYRLARGWTVEDALDTPREKPGRLGQYDVLLKAFGRTKGLPEWERDPRCVVTRTALQDRLRRGIPPEEALSTPSYEHRSSRPAHESGRKGVQPRRRRARS